MTKTSAPYRVRYLPGSSGLYIAQQRDFRGRWIRLGFHAYTSEAAAAAAIAAHETRPAA